jgi:hypothetical protein
MIEVVCLHPEAFARTPEASGGRGKGLLRVLRRVAVLEVGGDAVTMSKAVRLGWEPSDSLYDVVIGYEHSILG